MSYAEGSHVTLSKLQTLRRRIREAVDMATRRSPLGWFAVSPPPSFGLYGEMRFTKEDATSKEEICEYFEWCWRIGQEPKHGTTAATFEVAFLAAMLWKHSHSPGEWKREREKQRTAWKDEEPRPILSPGEEKACEEDFYRDVKGCDATHLPTLPPGDRQADPCHEG
jgi:hypothetical protein